MKADEIADEPDSANIAESSPRDWLQHLYGMPGFLIRRAKQKSTALFIERCSEFGMTPPQYAVLRILEARPGLDQGEVAEMAHMDEATVGGILDRLQNRGLTIRRRDGRRRIAFLSDAGKELLVSVKPTVTEIQNAILSPLTEREQKQLTRLLSKLTGTPNEHHRPRRSRGKVYW